MQEFLYLINLSRSDVRRFKFVHVNFKQLMRARGVTFGGIDAKVMIVFVYLFLWGLLERGRKLTQCSSKRGQSYTNSRERTKAKAFDLHFLYSHGRRSALSLYHQTRASPSHFACDFDLESLIFLLFLSCFLSFPPHLSNCTVSIYLRVRS